MDSEMTGEAARASLRMTRFCPSAFRNSSMFSEPTSWKWPRKGSMPGMEVLFVAAVAMSMCIH